MDLRNISRGNKHVVHGNLQKPFIDINMKDDDIYVVIEDNSRTNREDNLSETSNFEGTTHQIDHDVETAEIKLLDDYTSMWQNSNDSMISIGHLCMWVLTLIFMFAIYSYRGENLFLFLYSIMKLSESVPIVLVIYNDKLKSHVGRKVLNVIHHFFPKLKYVIRTSNF